MSPTNPEPVKPSQRRLPAERRRARILAAARDTFAAHGYEGVRTHDLARAAGVSQALLYRHFGGKGDLYCETLRLTSEALRDEMASATGPGRTPGRLEAGLRTFIDFVSDSKNGWALLTAPVNDPEINAYQRQARSACMTTLVDLFARDIASASPHSARVRLEQIAEVVAGGAEALAKWSRQNPNAERAEAAALFAQFVRQGIASLATARGSPAR
jgi:AcrR family transcriptional regulator